MLLRASFACISCSQIRLAQLIIPSLSAGDGLFVTFYGVGRKFTKIWLNNLCRSNIKETSFQHRQQKINCSRKYVFFTGYECISCIVQVLHRDTKNIILCLMKFILNEMIIYMLPIHFVCSQYINYFSYLLVIYGFRD